MTPRPTRTDGAPDPESPTQRISISMVALVVALLALVVVGIPAGTARACSCDELPLASYADEAIAAFVGRQTDRVVEDEFDENGAELTFHVAEVFFGDVSPELRVRTEADFDSCGVDFEDAGVVGILVFEFRGAPTVGACPAAVSHAELESVFGPSTAPTEPGGDASDANPSPASGAPSTELAGDATGASSSQSNDVARAALIGLLLVILVAGAVVVRHRRQQPRSDLT